MSKEEKLAVLLLLFFVEFLKRAKSKEIKIDYHSLIFWFNDDYILKDEHSGWPTMTVLDMFYVISKAFPSDIAKIPFYYENGNKLSASNEIHLDVRPLTYSYFPSFLINFKEFILRGEKKYVYEDLKRHLAYLWFIYHLCRLSFEKKLKVFPFIPIDYVYNVLKQNKSLKEKIKKISRKQKSTKLEIKLYKKIPNGLPFVITLEFVFGEKRSEDAVFIISKVSKLPRYLETTNTVRIILNTESVKMFPLYYFYFLKSLLLPEHSRFFAIAKIRLNRFIRKVSVFDI